MCSGGVGEKRWQRTSSKAGAGSSRRDCCQRRLCCLPAAIASFPPHFTKQPHLPPLQSLWRRLHHPTSCRCHRHSFHRCLLSSPLAARADFAACPLPLLLALPPSPKLLPLPPLQSLRRRLRHPTARAAVAIATAAIAAGCQRQLCCLPRCHCFPLSPPHTHTASPAPARKPAASPAPPHSPPLSSPLAASTGFDACPLPLLLPHPTSPNFYPCPSPKPAASPAPPKKLPLPSPPLPSPPLPSPLAASASFAACPSRPRFKACGEICANPRAAAAIATAASAASLAAASLAVAAAALAAAALAAAAAIAAAATAAAATVRRACARLPPVRIARAACL